VKPWKWPLVIVAILAPIIASFYIGGGGVGLGAGGLVAVAIMIVAVRQRPHGPIVPAPTADERRHVLLVTTCPVEEPAAVERIARAGGLENVGPGETDVLVLAPARIRFLDRWASDVESARQAAQRNLVATVAALAKAGVEAEARVGDEDVVQAVEDQLQTYPATRVVLVSGADREEGDGAAAEELGERLEAGFDHVVIRPG
jgi:hypothetical protein